MSDLTRKKCKPCESGTAPLTDDEEQQFLNQLTGWSLDKKKIHQLHKLYKFKNLSEAVKFVSEVARLAEDEGHHPDIYISYQYVTIVLWTKKIAGLSENDFIMAANIDALAKAK